MELEADSQLGDIMMNHETQNEVLVALINQVRGELKGDIADIKTDLSKLQVEYDAVLQVQLEMLATQKATKRIVKWIGGTITLLIGIFQLVQLILSVI